VNAEAKSGRRVFPPSVFLTGRKKLNFYKKVIDGLCKFFEAIAAVMLAVMILIIFYHVVMRYFFNMAPRWSEEVARQLMICFSFIAITLGVRDKIHLALTIIVDNMPSKAVFVIEIAEKIIILILGAAMCWFSIPYITRLMTNRLPATGIPVGYQYMIPAVCGGLIALVVVWQLASQLRSGETEAKTLAKSAARAKEESAI
jgi:TRAP-type C4-dicarboxylate transport system permease small subunit